MVTVLRAEGLRVVIYLNDRLPAHVHVYGDGEAKIDIAGEDGSIELVWAVGMSKAEVRRAMTLVAKYRDDLRMRWREIHG